MKKTLLYINIVLLAAAMVSCEKNDGPVGAAEGKITFSPSGVPTRALIQDDSALQAETFKVYDYLDGEVYIDNTISYAGGEWTYGEEQTYLWKNGSHKFFGFTYEAGTWMAGEKKLNIEKTLTTQTQDDLLYSEIITTTAADWKAAEGHTVETPVSLHFKHLFSAVAITVQNFSGNEVTLNSVSKPAIPNSGSVTVDFSGDDAALTYGTVTADGDFSDATALSGLTLAAAVEAQEATDDSPAIEAQDGGKVDAIAQADVDEPGYWMVWPQEVAEDAIKVTVNYTMNGQPYEKEISLPAATWEQGKKYSYTLAIYPTEVRLVFNVQPWNGVEKEIDTATGSINMSNVTWMNSKVTVDGTEKNTVDNSAKEVYMYYKPTVNGETYTANNGYYPAQGYFTVNYPEEGLFKIGLIPAYGETTVDTSRYAIYIYDYTTDPAAFRAINTAGETITNNTVYFQVRAASGQDGAQHKAQVNIWFKPNGSDEWISAYSEVRANYALVIPATPATTN